MMYGHNLIADAVSEYCTIEHERVAPLVAKGLGVEPNEQECHIGKKYLVDGYSFFAFLFARDSLSRTLVNHSHPPVE